MSTVTNQFEACRQEFPALARRDGDQLSVFFDGPAGTQVPQAVIDAISNYLTHCNANHEGCFPTSMESDELLHRVHQGGADLLGADDPETIAFGPNMTTLTFALSRALAQSWQAGDEVIVTRLDHDANVTPWVLAARDAGATVRYVGLRADDCTLDIDHLRELLSERTRLVAVGCASNATGGINPIRQICDWARQAGALSFVDAVHFAPHARIDVTELGCDFLACSAYKFFGPHIGLQWGRRDLLESIPAYKLRPASDDLPGKWMTGTQNHECLAGTLAAIDYLAGIGRRFAENDSLSRPEALNRAFAEIVPFEQQLVQLLLDGLQAIPEVRVWGITDPDRKSERLPTVSLTHERFTAKQLAETLASAGIFAWHGNYYALQLTETLGLEPEGMLRIGLVHYNTAAEIERCLTVLREL